MPEIKMLFQEKVAVVQTAEIEVIQVSERSVAYRITRSASSSDVLATKGPLFVSPAPTQIEGVATLAEIEAYIRGETATIEREHPVSLLPVALLEDAKKVGFMHSWELNQAAYDLIARRPFAYAVENPGCPEALVAHMDTSNHFFFAENGDPLPVGIHFSYISGHMDNGRLDLQKALALLQQDERVSWNTAKNRARKNEKIVAEIQEIPYYNREEGRTHYLDFFFAPTAEQMVELSDFRKARSRKSPFTALQEAVFELDLLGLRAAGAYLTPEFSSSYYG